MADKSGAAASAADLLALILDRALEARQKGLLELELGGVRVKFAPLVEDAPAPASKPEPEALGFDDPELYGLPKGAPVPGFAALRERREKGAS